MDRHVNRRSLLKGAAGDRRRQPGRQAQQPPSPRRPCLQQTGPSQGPLLGVVHRRARRGRAAASSRCSTSRRQDVKVEYQFQGTYEETAQKLTAALAGQAGAGRLAPLRRLVVQVLPDQRPGAAQRPDRRQRDRHRRLRRLALQRGRPRRRLATGCRSPARPRSSTTTAMPSPRSGWRTAPEIWSELVEVAPELVQKDGDTVTRSAFAHPTGASYIAWLFQGVIWQYRRALLRPRFQHPHDRAEGRRGRRVLPLLGRGRLGHARRTTPTSTSSTV